MDIEEKKIIYRLITKELEKVKGELDMIKKEIKKEKKFLCRFEDGSEEVVSVEDMEIVTDPILIAKALHIPIYKEHLRK